MDKWLEFRLASLAAELAGAAEKELKPHQVELLAQAVDNTWEAINPHNAMELVSSLATQMGQANAGNFLRQAIPSLARRSDYEREVRSNTAAHCLVAAVLANDLPDLLTPELIQSQAQYLSSYDVGNCPYAAEQIEALRKHITPHLR